MNAKQLGWALCAGLTFGAACTHGQSGHAAAESSGQEEEAKGDELCAREPGEPPEVGEGAETVAQRPCASSHSVMGESAKRPEEL